MNFPALREIKLCTTKRSLAMTHWYEVFDNEQVRLLTGKQAATLTVVPVSVLAATFVLVAMSRSGLLSEVTAGALIFPAWLGSLVWMVRRVLRLRRLVWCLKLSDEAIGGYDYARRQTVIRWDDVQRIQLTENGLIVEGPEGRSLEISHLFPDFYILSHRIFQYAEANGVALYVNGRPWEEVDVYALYPMLGPARREDAGPEPPVA